MSENSLKFSVENDQILVDSSIANEDIYLSIFSKLTDGKLIPIIALSAAKHLTSLGKTEEEITSFIEKMRNIYSTNMMNIMIENGLLNLGANTDDDEPLIDPEDVFGSGRGEPNEA